MRNYRDKYDIIADILNIVKKNPKKTQIMYQANLSYKVLKKYLTKISEAFLISYDKEGNFYSLTEKGCKFLVLYEEYSKTNVLLLKKIKEARLKKAFLEELCIIKNS